MKWTNIREICPNRWVLVEALATQSNNQKRTIDEMSLIAEYGNPIHAWSSYRKFHSSDPAREIYVFYTGNEFIELIELPSPETRKRQSRSYFKVPSTNE
ncbi:hypothetical protein [Paenibacillus aceti]|uniref:Phage protein n=1 Tax=Paenibacillus aceti TaxID=1820010 RepID=A0ABQ1VRI7_9BACL|nr:hypothetical protein [Paenibacillus aceti]GGF92809.1 hypothetical protein GCM10010913_12950 [Paenibacillus aceti]